MKLGMGSFCSPLSAFLETLFIDQDRGWMIPENLVGACSVAIIKLSGLCRLCTQVCITLEALNTTPKNTWLKRPLYGFTLNGADSRIAPEFSVKLARCTPGPLSEACCYPPERTNQGPRVPSRAIGSQAGNFNSPALPAGLSHPARHRGAGAMVGSTIQYGA